MRVPCSVVKPTHCASQKAYLLMLSHEDPTEFRYRVGASPWPCVVPPKSFFSPFLWCIQSGCGSFQRICRHIRLVSILLFLSSLDTKMGRPLLIGGKKNVAWSHFIVKYRRTRDGWPEDVFCPSKSVALQRIIQPYWSPPT